MQAYTIEGKAIHMRVKSVGQYSRGNLMKDMERVYEVRGMGI
jgi:hypothetical protein